MSLDRNHEWDYSKLEWHIRQYRKACCFLMILSQFFQNPDTAWYENCFRGTFGLKIVNTYKDHNMTAGNAFVQGCNLQASCPCVSRSFAPDEGCSCRHSAFHCARREPWSGRADSGMPLLTGPALFTCRWEKTCEQEGRGYLASTLKSLSSRTHWRVGKWGTQNLRKLGHRICIGQQKGDWQASSKPKKTGQTPLCPQRVDLPSVQQYFNKVLALFNTCNTLLRGRRARVSIFQTLEIGSIII